MGEREPLDDLRPTHSMCEPCFAHFSRRWEGLRLGEYLDEFDVPVALVEGDSRVVAANQRMADLLGRSDREVQGLLGGEVFECVNSRLPGGCGKTVCCATCTIRRAVTRARDGEDQVDVPAWVDRDGERLEVRISTSEQDGVVRLSILQAVVRKTTAA